MDYLISDLHLDHDNIIDYCDRPFSSVKEMNETLVKHWNAVVDPDDEVLYGSDLTIRTSAAALLDWLDELNGKIVFLLGNHDSIVLEELDRVQFVEEFRFEHRGVPFHAVHDPADGPSNWKGWLLHGPTTTTGRTDFLSSTTIADVSISRSSYSTTARWRPTGWSTIWPVANDSPTEPSLSTP
ncbi:metallophosphoesterase [Haloplanus rubicundus]|uniref:Calcineurin-like phosphoesterase domain-containing protein n=1 Tax=Haloplanus rubicundus TaxID=1547898 RepID=A0A345E8I2_9EURY|nr:metallophosphoesterase [Haloplanus rubicundus]AXG08504.1 hypothetical protein DU484_00835 [Haloplanus rubicundus]